jgi:ABC-type dipeptide/oligopeptide/nickel transport system permease component
MSTFVIRQIFRVITVLLTIETIVFIGLNLTGDPIRALLPPTATKDDIEALKKQLGMDKPLMTRYGIFISQLLKFDFGKSLRTSRLALQEALTSVKSTLLLASVSMLTSAVVGLLLGILIATSRSITIRRGILICSLIGQSLPSFWIGLLFIYLFALRLRILPTYGYGSWRNIVLPALTLTVFLFSSILMLTYVSFNNILQEMYILTARAKGLSELSVIFKHAFRNASIPIVTQIVTQLRFVLGGSVVVESIFGWPGLGRLLAQAAFSRDYPVVAAGTVIMTLLAMVLNVLLDLLYTVLDPRIRYY